MVYLVGSPYFLFLLRHTSQLPPIPTLPTAYNVVTTIKMRPMSRISLSVHIIRQFATSRPQSAKNRVYTTIRTPNELSNLLLLSTSSNVPLITYWTMSWYSQSKSSIAKILIEEDGVGEAEGGVGYVEVEMDAPTIEGLDVEYGVCISALWYRDQIDNNTSSDKLYSNSPSLQPRRASVQDENHERRRDSEQGFLKILDTKRSCQERTRWCWWELIRLV